MRKALVLGFAVALAMVAHAATAADCGPSGTPTAAAPKPPATTAAAQKTTVQAGASTTVTRPARSLRDDRAIRETELRDRRREQRMLSVTESICRGC